MSTPDLVIETSGLAKSYGAVTALRSLDLAVPRHSIFGFLGPNGAGKTTAMRLLLGLARPTAGHASVLGHDVVTQSVQVRRRIGYLPQQPRFFDELTPRETLRFARGFFPPDPERSVEAQIDEALGLVGLVDKRDARVGDLSGGQRQRLGIAQAQIHKPELLILDEPAAALDPIGRRDVLEIMRALRATTTVFYSTHILDDVQRVSDTVAILHEGVCVAQAAVDELVGNVRGARYDLAMSGDVSTVAERLRTQPWIAQLQPLVDHDQPTLRITVTDEDVARHRLLRVVLEDPAVEVREFTPTRTQLEDVFLQLVEGSST